MCYTAMAQMVAMDKVQKEFDLKTLQQDMTDNDLADITFDDLATLDLHGDGND